MSQEESNMTTARDEFVKDALMKYESSLIGYAVGFLHDVEKAKDVVQDTFIRLYQQDIEKLGKGLKAWLFTVCRNRSLDLLRKEKRVVGFDDQALESLSSGRRSPAERSDLVDRLIQLHEALSRLSENQREVILLKFEQGLSYQEISEVTGLSSSNVGFILHHGLKKLRSVLPRDLLTNLTPSDHSL